MISKRIKGRKDGKSSAAAALGYGEGLTPDKETGELLDKSHRTRLGNFGLVDDGVYVERDDMADVIEMASLEMQSNIDINTRVGSDKKLAHFVVSYNQDKPSEAVLRDTEDSMLAAMSLDKNHFATFLHNDNGYWHLHIFASRIEKEKPHKGNPLWQDKTIRDKICREIEIRHGLPRDNGMHKVDEHGQIVEIPRAERIANREAKPAGITDRARTKEIYSGEKSFQTWVTDIRLGDRLKHAKNWQDMHALAAAYGCEVKPKGAGFVVCPAGEKGGIQLSKIGIKNLPAKFGSFATAKTDTQAQPETTYKPAPTQEKAASHYDKWRKAKNAFQPIKTNQINVQRETNKQTRTNLRARHKLDLEKIRTGTKGQERVVAVSVAKMEQSIALSALADQFAHDRQELRRQLAGQGPGNTFRDFLILEAGKGDNEALTLARKYGVEETTEVLCKRAADKLKVAAFIAGSEHQPARRLCFTHYVDRSGSIVFDLGHGRRLVDSAISKQVQLNDVAAHDPESIATALRFAASKFGNTLTLTGSEEFQKLAVETAVQKGLFVKFSAPALDAYREKLVAEQKQKFTTSPKRNLTPQQLTKGAEHVLRTGLDHGIPPNHILRAADAAREESRALPQRGGSLHAMPPGGLDGEPQDTGLLLPDAIQERMGNPPAGQDSDLRRAGAGETSSRSHLDATHATSELHPSPVADLESRDRIVRPSSSRRLDGEATQRGGIFPVNAVDVDLAVALAVDSSIAVNQQAQRAAASAAELPVLHAEVAIVPTIPTPLLPAVDWVDAQSKPLHQAYQHGDSKTELTIVHISDVVVVDQGRAVAQYPIPLGINLHVGQKVIIDKNGLIALPFMRSIREVGKGGQGD